MADSKKYNGSQWEHSLRKLGTATDTITTLPADVYADGNNATVGLVGNMQQTGTPTPTTPIQPSETGERTGNLYFKKIVNATINADGSITSNNSFDCYLAKVEANKQYIGTGFVYSFFVNEPYIGSGGSYDGQRVVAQVSDGFASPIDGYVAVRHNTGVTDAMLNTGSTPLPYEPYGIKIPISSANTTTPVYLGEVESTRQIKKIVFVGSEDENWSAQSAGGGAMRFRYTLGNSIQADTTHLTSICTHLPLGVEGGTWSTDNIYTISNNYLWLRLDSSFTTVSALKSWLAQQYANGTPVTIWYVLANETTGIVNEPLQKIGDYADSISGISIPTTDGANTVSVDTTVQPSEMTMTYHGWHTGAVHERESGSWD